MALSCPVLGTPRPRSAAICGLMIANDTGVVMSVGVIGAVGAILVATVVAAAWMFRARSGPGPAEGVASQAAEAAPEPEPSYEEMDPAERVTLPPTTNLYDDEDAEDAVTVMASSDDMAELMADLRKDP